MTKDQKNNLLISGIFIFLFIILLDLFILNKRIDNNKNVFYEKYLKQLEQQNVETQKKIDSLNILLEKERLQNLILKEDIDYSNQKLIICADTKSQLLFKIDSLQKLNNELKIPNSPLKEKSSNYFGSGGSGNGFGNGPFGGPNSSSSSSSIEGKSATRRESGSGRVVFNNVSLPQYNLDFECRIQFKLLVDAEGKVLAIKTLNPTTTCSDVWLINDIKERIKRELRYNKVQGAEAIEINYSINLIPRG